MTLEFDLSLLESYWAGKAAYTMEQGKYYIFIGKNAALTEMAGCLELSGTVLMSELHSICPLLTSLTEIEPADKLVEAWEKEFAEICRRRRRNGKTVRIPARPWTRPPDWRSS